MSRNVVRLNQETVLREPQGNVAARSIGRGNASYRGSKGSLKKLADLFYADMLSAWQAQGPEIIKRTIDAAPQAFLRTCSSLIPKEHDITVNRFEHMSSEELEAELLSKLREAGLINEPTGDTSIDDCSALDPSDGDG